MDNHGEITMSNPRRKTEGAGTKDKTGKPVLSISVVPIAVSNTSPSDSTPTGVFHTPHFPSPLLEIPLFTHANKSAVQLGDSGEKAKGNRPASLRRTSSSHNRMTRSMTDAELASEAVTAVELLDIKERLLNEQPPKSLDEAREDARVRRASIVKQEADSKMIRKASVSLLRVRAASRAAQLGLPSPTGEGFPVLTENVPLQLPERAKTEEGGK